jgi:hypothetical protein
LHPLDFNPSRPFHLRFALYPVSPRLRPLKT